ncbi:MAG TPA: COX15/CtaA family protein [Trebonia sp.]|nr:COX15/CtaA family protein [Trebonia sp.]
MSEQGLRVAPGMALSRIAGSFWWPTRASVRGWALAAVISNAVIITTGAAVRLSSSGLGCDDWPTCTTSSLIAAHVTGQSLLNTWIEFSNRLLNYPLVAIAGLVFIACWRYRADGQPRRDLIRLSAVLPLGIVAQAVVGGLVVLTKLNPAMVAVHFLLSSGLLAVAVALHVRVSEGEGRARPVVRPDLRVLAWLLAGATAAMLVAGTVVTGTGPLAGTQIDSHGHYTTVPRFHLPLVDVTQFHADIAWFISATSLALAIGLRYSAAPARVRRQAWVVVGGVILQALIGYTQYFLHLPAGLVWVHVAGAVLLWIAVLQLNLSTRERLPVAAATVTVAAQAAPATAGPGGATGATGATGAGAGHPGH